MQKIAFNRFSLHYKKKIYCFKRALKIQIGQFEMKGETFQISCTGTVFIVVYIV